MLDFDINLKALLHLIHLNAHSNALWNAHRSPWLESSLMCFYCFYTSSGQVQEQLNRDIVRGVAAIVTIAALATTLFDQVINYS